MIEVATLKPIVDLFKQVMNIVNGASKGLMRFGMCPPLLSRLTRERTFIHLLEDSKRLSLRD
jgi:hypothetical protein